MTVTNDEEQNGGSSVRNVTEGSRLVATAHAAANWVRHSSFYQWMTREHDETQEGGSTARGVTESSRLVLLARATGNWVRQSFLYRWLTKEPEPDVIVIDLRETYVVGPFITILDRIAARLGPWWRDSGCQRVCALTAAWLVARPIRAFGLTLLAVATLRLLLAAAGGTLSRSTLAVSFGLFSIGALATRSRHSWQDIQATRSYQLLAAILEPPQPPEQQEPSSDDRDT